MRVIAVLDTYWNWRDLNAGETQAPPFFRINPDNHSGRRLYRIIGPQARLLVTNACREIVRHAHDHGKPDPAWLASNLRYLETRGFDVLLICGRVAQGAYDACGWTPTQQQRTYRIMHPAARTWSKARIHETMRLIQGPIHIPGEFDKYMKDKTFMCE